MRARGEEPQGGLPRNYLRASLLLLLAETPAHGYDLLEQIGGLGLSTVDPGGLYRALRVMEQDGLVESWWEHSNAGPARRSYRLTDEGSEWLHAWAGTLREGRRFLSAYLERYDTIAGPAYQGIAGPAYQGIAGPAYKNIAGPAYKNIAGPAYQGIAAP